MNNQIKKAWETPENLPEKSELSLSVWMDRAYRLRKLLEKTQNESEEFRDSMREHIWEGDGTFSWEDKKTS